MYFTIFYRKEYPFLENLISYRSVFLFKNNMEKIKHDGY